MHQSQTTSSLILLTISLLSTTTSALPQPQWAESSAGEYVATTEAPVYATSAASNWATAVTWPAGCETWANPCPAGALTSGIAPTPAAITWPAGCQNWANPCPASAIISQGEPYTNPFTSYTTMTNSAGIITGMPPVATSAGGVASVLSEQSSALATGGSSAATMAKASSAMESSGSVVSPTASATNTEAASATTDNSFSQATFSGAAVANRAAGGLAAMAVGLAFVL